MQEEPPRCKMMVVLLVLPAVFLLYGVLTGGLVVSTVRDFGAQRDVVLVRGVESDLWLVPRLRRFGLPLVFHYRSEAKPFGLRVQIWDRTNQYRAIELREILIEYEDGEVVRKKSPWTRQLRPHRAYQSSSLGVTSTDLFMLSDEIPDLVLRHLDVKITLTGHLVRADGTRVAFKASEKFGAQSSRQISTYWQEVASR